MPIFPQTSCLHTFWMKNENLKSHVTLLQKNRGKRYQVIEPHQPSLAIIVEDTKHNQKSCC